MPVQTPQVLSRKQNGAAPTEKASGSEPAKEKPAGKSSSGRSRRGRGRRDRNKDKKTDEGGKLKPAKPKQQQDGCKLIIRRLPPSMTENEVTKILGESWEVGKGKVDWFSFAKGKIPTDTAKSARPGRAYIYLTKKEDAVALDEHVRTSTWEDAKGSFNNACLIGPPLLEYSIYKKTPLNKRHGDTRQGTIDQDPEFMAFLEELASPPVFKDAADDGDDMSKSTKVTTTPLVEFLKEKKASKSKEAANKKREARAEKNKAKDEESSKKKGKDTKQEKAPKVSVKILTKKGTAEPDQEAARRKQGKDTNVPAATTDAGQDAPKSRRAEIAAAAKALQRDQGLSPGTAHRKARQDAARADANARSEVKAENKENTARNVEDGDDSKVQGKTKSQGRKRGGKNADKPKADEVAPTATPTILKPPVILKKGKDDLPTDSTDAPASSTIDAPPVATSAPKAAGGKAAKQNKKQPAAVIQDGTRGFVRHVNSSQGITADTLREALSAFGTVKMVDVDRRKAFAYVDFADAESLTKAIAASPVTVAQGSVTVMERKEKKPAADNTEKKDKGREKKEKPATSA